jgi:hypothetical protein
MHHNKTLWSVLGRRWKRSALTAGLVIGLVVLTGQPAAAYPTWQTFTTNSTWHCSGRLSSPTSIADIRVCVIVNGNYAQAVTRIRNTTSDWIQIASEPTKLIKNGQTAAENDCDQSNLGATLERACFGATISGSCGTPVKAYTWSLVRRVGATWSTASGETDSGFRYCS